MYLGDCCMGNLAAVRLPTIRRLPQWAVRQAPAQSQCYALQTPHFKTLKPTFASPGDRYPIWALCGNQPGSGSPCNRQAIARFKELKASGKAWPEISSIMAREGSLKHYAGF